MAGYAWRRDETPRPPEPTSPAPEPPKRGRPTGKANKPFDPSKCGTMTGWRQHRAHGQEECRKCKDAQNEYMRKYRAPKRAA